MVALKFVGINTLLAIRNKPTNPLELRLKAHKEILLRVLRGNDKSSIMERAE